MCSCYRVWSAVFITVRYLRCTSSRPKNKHNHKLLSAKQTGHHLLSIQIHGDILVSLLIPAACSLDPSMMLQKPFISCRSILEYGLAHMQTKFQHL